MGMGMADMNTVIVVNMAVAVAISTPALAIAKSMSTMVYPITKRSIPIALHEGFVVYA
jgi:hypothetical protein